MLTTSAPGSMLSPPPPTTAGLPERIPDETQLDELQSRPDPTLIADFSRLQGDLMVLGVAGKVGPSLARMAKRARPDRRVVGVARFSNPQVRRSLEAHGIETIACDLLDRRQVEALPCPPNLVFMVGRKFGTAAEAPLTWAMNVQVPALVAEHFAASRIVAFSTLCVYPFTAVDGPGSAETEAPTPLGEYANSCVGRERCFQYGSTCYGTAGRLLRLTYAIDLRYGVLHDLGMAVHSGKPVDLTTPVVPVIWQADAVNQILRSLLHCTVPSSPLNIGPVAPAGVQAVAEAFGRHFGRTPVFTGRPAADAWYPDCRQANTTFGPPAVTLERMIAWNVDWIARGGTSWRKPTCFSVRNGVF